MYWTLPLSSGTSDWSWAFTDGSCLISRPLRLFPSLIWEAVELWVRFFEGENGLFLRISMKTQIPVKVARMIATPTTNPTTGPTASLLMDGFCVDWGVEVEVMVSVCNVLTADSDLAILTMSARGQQRMDLKIHLGDCDFIEFWIAKVCKNLELARSRSKWCLTKD